MYLFEYEDGSSEVTDSCGNNLWTDYCNIIKKHDDRPWIKDLPPAEWFEWCDIKLIYQSSAGSWYGITHDHDEIQLRASKMPETLFPSRGKTELLIIDLKEWQSKKPQVKLHCS